MTPNPSTTIPPAPAPSTSGPPSGSGRAPSSGDTTQPGKGRATRRTPEERAIARRRKKEAAAQSRRERVAAAPSDSRWQRLRAPVAVMLDETVRPVLAVITPIGWSVLLVAVLAWVFGTALHITELLAIALVLTIPLVIAALFVLGRAAYAVTLDLQTHRVVVGTRAVGRVVVANPSQRTILPSRIELAVGRATAQFLVPRLAAQAEHEELFAVPTKRRAVLVIGPVRSVRDDPLSLMRRQVTWAREQELFVHPKIIRLDDAASGYLRDLEGTPSSDLSSSDIAFHALRDYSPGDDRRHVHWRTTARTGKLMVRQFEETRRSHIVVALDNRDGDYETEDEFELAVSAAASISAQTFREEKELTAFTFDLRQRTKNYRQMMDDYTVLDRIGGRHRMLDLGQKATDLAPNASAVMMIVGSNTSARDLHAASTRMPAGILAVGIRCVQGAEVQRSALGSLELVTLGDLDDLPKALRAVNA